MAHSNRRPDPVSLPGILPALEVCDSSQIDTLPSHGAFLAVLRPQVGADRIFDALREMYVRLRTSSEAPVCFATPDDPAALSAFVDAVALMPELVLTPARIDVLVPGAVGLFRQFGARWLAEVGDASDLSVATEAARNAGFRGAPVPIACSVTAWQILSDPDPAFQTLWGVRSGVPHDADLTAVARQRAVIVCARLHEMASSPLGSASPTSTAAFGEDHRAPRNVLGINEIREPCG